MNGDFKMKDGFIRAGAATPEIKVADCDYNAEKIISLINEAAEKGVSVLVFPELCITGATCGDLFLQKALIDGARKALDKILEATKDIDMLVVVGMPIIDNERSSFVFNCGVIIHDGVVLGVSPKMNIPKDSNERRYFTPWEQTDDNNRFEFLERTQILRGFQIGCQNIPELLIDVKIGEDLLISDNKFKGTLILNPYASPEIVGAYENRRLMAKSQSKRLNCGIVCAGAGKGESTTDYVYGGHSIIAEDGKILTESKRFTTGLVYTEIDVQTLPPSAVKSTFQSKAWNAISA